MISSVVMFSAAASYVNPILCLNTSWLTALMSSGIIYPLRFIKAKAFAASARFILALGDAPKLINGIMHKIINE